MLSKMQRTLSNQLIIWYSICKITPQVTKKVLFTKKKLLYYVVKLLFFTKIVPIAWSFFEKLNTGHYMRQLKITKQVTNRDTPSLDKYLQEIGRVDLISPEEEVILARRIKSGETEALRKLVKANLRFVVSVAKQYQNQGVLMRQEALNSSHMPYGGFVRQFFRLLLNRQEL